MSEIPNIPPDAIGSQLVREDAAFTELVTEFVGGLGAQLDVMQTALRGADFDVLKTSAHRLKGSGGGYGYPILSEHAAVLERHAAQQAMDDCIAAFDELKAVCNRVVPDAAS